MKVKMPSVNCQESSPGKYTESLNKCLFSNSKKHHLFQSTFRNRLYLRIFYRVIINQFMPGVPLKGHWQTARGGGGGGGGGVGRERGGYPIYGIVRMCVPNSPLFQCCQVYDWPPFFNKKYMNGPIFQDSYVKGPIFLTSWYMHMFFAQRFFEAAYPLGST